MKPQLCFITAYTHSLSLLQFYPHKRHKSDTHQASDNERDANTSQALGNLGITQFFADGGDGHDSQQPAYARAEAKYGGFTHVAEATLLHEERAAQDGTVHRNQRKENAQGGIERRREGLNHHLQNLHDGCDDGDEKDIGQEAQIDRSQFWTDP